MTISLFWCLSTKARKFISASVNAKCTIEGLDDGRFSPTEILKLFYLHCVLQKTAKFIFVRLTDKHFLSIINESGKYKVVGNEEDKRDPKKYIRLPKSAFQTLHNRIASVDKYK